jgi:multimeric flavodoxin WrbA
MTVLAFNGSPRKNGTTAKLLKEALRGAESTSAKTEFVHLSDLKMTSCTGCFGCKQRSKGSTPCVLRDDFTPYYKKIESATGILVGSPIYFFNITAEFKMLVDRMFPYFNYEGKHDGRSNLPKPVKFSTVVTQGNPDPEAFKPIINGMGIILARAGFVIQEGVYSTNTYHVEDYSKIIYPQDEEAFKVKAKYREEQFPKDMQAAFELGRDLSQASD